MGSKRKPLRAAVNIEAVSKPSRYAATTAGNTPIIGHLISFIGPAGERVTDSRPIRPATAEKAMADTKAAGTRCLNEAGCLCLRMTATFQYPYWTYWRKS